MKYHALALVLTLISTLTFAQGRGPAVEDFVGIEVQHPEEVSPIGTEALFNLEKDMLAVDKQKNANSIKPNTIDNFTWNITAVFGVSILLGLPLMSWLAAMHHMRKKAHVQSASNIEVLENYRKEREAKKRETFKKVS